MVGFATRSISVVCCSVLMSACSVRPIPDGVTGYSTYEIVRKIQCETRDALAAEMVELLALHSFPENKIDTTNHIVLAKLIADPTALRELEFAELKGDVEKLVRKYAKSTIAFNFVFEITENNNDSAGLTLNDPLTNGSIFSLVANVGSEKGRKNRRNFVISNSVTELVVGLPDGDECFSGGIASPVYPITGTIGMQEMISTFRKLFEDKFSGLGALSDQKTAEASFSDTITFTTTSYGVITPKLGGNPALVTEINGNIRSDRTDIHTVIISLVVPKPEEPPKPTSVTPSATPLQVSPPVTQPLVEGGEASSGLVFAMPATEVQQKAADQAKQDAVRATVYQREFRFEDRVIDELGRRFLSR